MTETAEGAPLEDAGDAAESPVEPDPATDEDGEPDGAGDGSDEAQEAAQEPEQEPEPGPTNLRSEKELEKAYKDLAKLRETVATKVSQIMGDDAVALIQCPTCSALAPGWLFPPDAVPFSPDQIGKMRSLLDLPTEGNYRQASNLAACSKCDGLGKVRTGSKVAGHEYMACDRCAGKGWEGRIEIPQNGVASVPSEPAAVVTGPSVYGTELPPDLAHYKAEGWVVVPPPDFHA